MINQAPGFHAQTWQQACYQLQQHGTEYVLATIIGAAGSTPRAAGTKMVITAENIYDTLGGGHLEFVVMQKARELLANAERGEAQSQQLIEHFPLAASLGQCCGGSATVLFELQLEQGMALDVYGAGHVAHALMAIVKDLPLRIRWIDARQSLFPAETPANIQCCIDEDPTVWVASAAANSASLILTHNHQLDFALTEAILKRGDACWLGVIGSDTKAQRFRQRLLAKGFSQSEVASMQSPVGLEAVSGKLPMEVAVSIAGALIQVYQSQQAPAIDHKKRAGLQWKQMQTWLSNTAETESSGTEKYIAE
ncbi:MAG: xanthine dehydrogenase accessory protein XdhC [Pseudomonadales bacterium]|nr:xanthine dehydrogenase accessory protein XdhC [Pseudomonadales bacterium]